MVVTQPSFIYYNGDRYLQTVPNYQLKSLYPIGSLMRSGVHVAGSSDCPIAPPNPLIGIYAAVNRRTKTGNKVLSEESITPLVSLKLYTTYAARATLQERNLGSITPGKMADLIVLNGDPTTLPPDDLKNIQVEMTVINGRILWDKSVLTHNSSFDV